MKICAIICEYNPLHNGHLKHIEESRRLSGADAVLCLMTGNFVQRGEPAILDKFTRARLALEAGADVVLELPTVYALSTAEKFAYGAVKILNAVPEITHFCFGSESGEIEPIRKVAEFLNNEPAPFKKLVQENLAKGSTLAAAKTQALLTLNNSGECKLGKYEDVAELISAPNSILGLEYMRAILATNSKITPLTIRREGSSYNSTELAGEYSSASAIRAAIRAGAPEDIRSCVPDFVLETLAARAKTNRVCLQTFSDIAMYRLRAMSAESLGELYDMGEGLENRIKTYADFATSLSSLVDAVKTKRYTHARLRRIMLYAVLGITKRAVQRTLKAEPYAKVLAVRKTRQNELLSALKASKLTSLVRREDYAKILTSANDAAVKIDLLATDVYALLNSDPTLKMGGQDYSTGLITG